MNMDYFHTTEGNPVYLKHADNFHDTRVRFKDLLPELRDIKNACTEVQILETGLQFLEFLFKLYI